MFWNSVTKQNQNKTKRKQSTTNMAGHQQSIEDIQMSKIKCECGQFLNKSSLKRHLLTIKHREQLEKVKDSKRWKVSDYGHCSKMIELYRDDPRLDNGECIKLDKAQLQEIFGETKRVWSGIVIRKDNDRINFCECHYHKGLKYGDKLLIESSRTYWFDDNGELKSWNPN